MATLELLEGRRSSRNHCSNEGHNGLKVHFSEKDEEQTLTVDEAWSRLRPQSKCLGKGECRKLQIFRHQHSSLETCNCKLEVLHTDGRDEESSCVPAIEVRRVDLTRNIHDNPVICDWIDSRSKEQGSHRLDTNNAESDMHTQLDEEINKITMMTDSFNETYLTTNQSLADEATDTPKRRRNLRSQSNSCQRRHRNEFSTNITRSRRSIDKQPRLSPLAARAALAATMLTGSPQQVTPPRQLESKEMGLHSKNFRPNSRPKKNGSRKCQRDLKAKEQSRTLH